MAGLLDFAVRFGTEERGLWHLAGLRWPAGFVCSSCGGRAAWRLKARPRVYECSTCHRQESVTAGTVFYRARAGLAEGVGAAYFSGLGKRGGVGGDGVSSDADGPREVVCCCLSDGPRQARRFGQVPATGTGGGVPDGVDHGA